MSAVTILLPGRDGSRQKHREVDMSDQSSCDKSRVAVLGLGHVGLQRLWVLWRWVGR